MSRTALRALFAASLLLLLAEPGHVPFFEPDEARYAEIPREMLESGDFVTPRLNGVLYFEKPPLHYWSVALSFRLFGETERAARLPSRVATAGMAVLAFLFARKRYGERAGLVAGLITASAALVTALARVNIIDPALSCALAGAAFAFAAFQEVEAESRAGGSAEETVLARRRARRALYGLHVASAAAVLLKGLVGLALPGGAILVWAALTGRWRVVPKLFSPGPLLVFLALAVPWHVLAARRNPDFLSFYFVHEHFERFTGTAHRRGAPPYYFLPVLLAGLAPWTAFLGRLRHSVPLARRAMRERPAEAFLAIFAALVFLFFSASRSKLAPYIQPMLAPLAVLVAAGMERAPRREADERAERLLLAVFFGAALAAAVSYGVVGGYIQRFDIAVPAAVLISGALMGLLAAIGPGRRDSVLAAGLPWLVMLAGVALAMPRVARAITPWPLVEVLRSELRPGDRVVEYGHFLEVIPFYTKRLTPIAELGWSELDFGRAHAHQPGLFLTHEEFARLWRGPERVLAIAHFGVLDRLTGPELEPSRLRILARSPNQKFTLVENRPR